MKRKSEIIIKIESSFHKPIEDVLKGMRQQGLSASQIHEEISQHVKIKFTKRSVQRWLKWLEIEFSQDEAGRLRWKNGLMSEAIKKTRRTLQETRAKGSKIEELIRWVLKDELEQLKGYEVIIGFTDWTILNDLEIDIPIVFIQKSSQKVSKFALEVDGERFHPDSRKWEEKSRRIKLEGWHPLRAIIHNEKLSRWAYQVYIKDNARDVIDFDTLITEIKTVLHKSSE